MLIFPIYSMSKETMKHYFTRYTHTGNLYCLGDWLTYTYPSIGENHVAVLKEKDIPKGRNHINSIEGFLVFLSTAFASIGYSQGLFSNLSEGSIMAI